MFQTLLISGSRGESADRRPAHRRRHPHRQRRRRDGASAKPPAAHIKKTVLELGGSDPFIVLADADLAAAVETGVRARFQNAGQSCIAAKRFIVEASVFDAFQERFVAAVRRLHVGDPMQRGTQLGPLARDDLRDGVGAAGARVGRPRRARAHRGRATTRPRLLLRADGADGRDTGHAGVVRRGVRSGGRAHPRARRR